MTNYRQGDEVLFETAAFVVGTDEDRVTIQFGDTQLHTTADTLSMVRRSIHVRDVVRHGDDRAIVSQTLEDGVFLLRMTGKTGVEAFRIVPVGELRHDDRDEALPPPPAPTPAPAPVDTHAPAADSAADEPEPVAPIAEEPAGDAVTADETHDHGEELLLDQPLPRGDDAPAAAEGAETDADAPAAGAAADEAEVSEDGAEEKGGNVAGMATALTSMITRGRRNLGTLGHTEDVKPVTAADAERQGE